MTESIAPAPRILTRDDSATIAYHAVSGKSPGVIFLTGYKSDMTGGKALFVEEVCRRLGNAFVRFDYLGHGESSGAFTDGTIGRWADDAVAVLDAVCEGPQVLVGSSMGGWIMLLAALERPGRVAGLLGIAAAPDFTEDLMPGRLDAEQKAALRRDGIIHMPSEYGPESTPLTLALIEEAGRHLLLRRRIPLQCPVRLIHGMQDADVPWQTSLRICQMLDSGDVEMTLVKDGGHRLSEPHDLVRLESVLVNLLEKIDSPLPDTP